MPICAAFFGGKCFKTQCPNKHEFVRCTKPHGICDRKSLRRCLFLHVSLEEIKFLNDNLKNGHRFISDEVQKELESLFGTLYYIRKNNASCYAIAIGKDRCPWSCQVCSRMFGNQDQHNILRCNMCQMPAKCVGTNDMFMLQCGEKHLFCYSCIFHLESKFSETHALPLLFCSVCQEGKQAYEFIKLFLHTQIT